MKTYSVGIVGFGMIGKVHAFGYATLPYNIDPKINANFRITHVATAHQETAEKAKTVCGADVATTDFRDITENPNIDIVHICSPNEQHVEQLISAIRHGKHIYCDKPLCCTLEEAEFIRSEMERCNYSATNQMTFHLRFFPAVMRMKQLIDEGRLGRILQFRAAFLHSSSVDPNAPFKWKYAKGGGVILDLGSHVLDIVDHLIGSIDSLVAQTQLAHPQRPVSAPSEANPNPPLCDVVVEDAVSMLVKMESGAHGVIEASKLSTGTTDDFRIEIHGEKGAVRFRLLDPQTVEFFDATVRDKPLGGTSGWLSIGCHNKYDPPHADFPNSKAIIGWTRAHAACLVNFLSAVATGKQTTPDLMQGFKIQRYMTKLVDR